MTPGFKEIKIESETKREIKKNVWTDVTQKNWEEVIKIYKKYPEFGVKKITKSGETALHMAIADGREEVVKELVKIIGIDALRVKNKLGNTPLHLAALLDNQRMCHYIADQDIELMGIRNNDDLTPIYVAVHHGRELAFLTMHRLLTTDDQRKLRNTYCRKKGGWNILHSAISGDHFELAFQIIHLYPNFIHRLNEKGFLPLHYLAMKPSIFKSGCPMGILHKFIYDHCIHVKKLKEPRGDEDSAKNSQTPFARNLQRLRYNTWVTTICGRKVKKQGLEDPSNDGDQQIDQKGEEHSLDMVPPRKNAKHFVGLRLVISEGKKAILSLIGYETIRKIIDEKRKHTLAIQIMYKLLEKPPPDHVKYEGNYRKHAAQAANDGDGDGDGDGDQGPQPEERNVDHGKKDEGNAKGETPLLVAAKNGIREMVEEILKRFPFAIQDVNKDDKNIVLLAVENRQPHIYQFLHDLNILRETIFYKTDKDDNSALHLAAALSDARNWNNPGPALHMQWDIKWYQFVESSMPKFFMKYNKMGETSWHVFQKTHTELVSDAGKWLSKTSESCSVVSTLIATVAFTAYATVPGGINSITGVPLLEREAMFHVFAIASLIALCFSVSSVVMFLVFFTSRYHEKDFATNLPTKLLVELTSLLIAVAALLVSFCAAHSFVIRDNLKYTAFPLYAATLIPVVLYAFWQIPTYFHLAIATCRVTPSRVYNYD